MKEHWFKLKEWYANLAVREKQAVTIGGIVLGIFFIYQFIWAALNNHVAAMRDKIHAEQKTLVWMQAAEKEINKIELHTKNKARSLSPVALLSILQKQADSAGLASQLTQLKQATNDSIEMHFQKVQFDKLIGLLTLVIKENNVAITQMSALAESTPGEVNADVTLKLG